MCVDIKTYAITIKKSKIAFLIYLFQNWRPIIHVGKFLPPENVTLNAHIFINFPCIFATF